MFEHILDVITDCTLETIIFICLMYVQVRRHKISFRFMLLPLAIALFNFSISYLTMFAQPGMYSVGSFLRKWENVLSFLVGCFILSLFIEIFFEWKRGKVSTVIEEGEQGQI